MKRDAVLIIIDNNESDINFLKNFLEINKFEYVSFYNPHTTEIDFYVAKDITNSTKKSFNVVQKFRLRSGVDEKISQIKNLIITTIREVIEK